MIMSGSAEEMPINTTPVKKTGTRPPPLKREK
jgi:hypothetical protein